MMNPKEANITRQFCSAAHLDWTFRDQVIKQVLEKEYEAIAHSHGVDLVAVIKHCLSARRRKTIRDILLLSLMIFLLLPAIYENNILFLIVSLIIAWFIVFIEEWTSRYKIIGRYLTKNCYLPDSIKFRSNKRLERIFNQIRESYNGNLIVYSGFSPFVGSGFPIGGWSVATNVDKGKEYMGSILKPKPFNVTDIYDNIINGINDLSLNNIIIKDKLHIDGSIVQNDKRFQSSPFQRPYSQVDAALIDEFKENSDEYIRYYLSIQLDSWKSELVLSIFLRIIKVGCRLFIEVNYYLLPPLSVYYHQFENIKQVPSW